MLNQSEIAILCICFAEPRQLARGTHRIEPHDRFPSREKIIKYLEFYTI